MTAPNQAAVDARRAEAIRRTERSLLGCMILNPELIDRAEGLRPNDFNDPDLAAVFTLLANLRQSGRVIDAATVAIHASSLPDWCQLTAGDLVELADVPSSQGGDTYLTEVRAAADRRRTGVRLKAAIEALSDPTLEPAEVVEGLTEDLRLAIAARGGVARPFSQSMARIPALALDRNHRPPPRRYILVRKPDDEADYRNGWEGVMPAGRVCMLAAAGGAGKTFAAIQLAIAVATGGAWFGAWQAQASGRILLALGEEKTEEVHRRLWEVADSLDLSDADRAMVIDRVWCMALHGKAIRLVDERGDRTPAHADLMDTLKREAGDDGWSLVVLDPLSRVSGSDTESDNSLATAFVTSLEALTEAPGEPTVFIAHHTSQAARQNKSAGATAARGVTALTDGIRWQATMAPVDEENHDLVRLHVGKTNYGKHPPDLMLARGQRGALRAVDPVVLASHNVGPKAGSTEAVALFLRDVVAATPGLTSDDLEAACKKCNGGPGVGKKDVAAARNHAVRQGLIFDVKEGRSLKWYPGQASHLDRKVSA